MRTCARCGIDKPLTAYWKQASRKDGLQAACIECMTSSHRAWSSGLPEDRKARRVQAQVAASWAYRQRDPLALLLASCKARAKKAGMEFSLSRGDVVIPDICPVLGIKIKFGVRRGRGLDERDCRPSIDRIDNAKGYTPENVVVVSYRANRIKSDANVNELLAIAKFYEALDEDRKRNLERGGGGASEVAGELCKDDMPRVQPEQKEEARPLLKRQQSAGRDCLLLSPLRAQRRGVL